MRSMSNVTTEAALRLGDSGNAIWTLAELQRYVKDGYDLLCRETLCLWSQTYLNDRAGQSDYVLPTDFVASDRATWNAKPMREISEGRLRTLDHQYQNESATTGKPESYYIDGMRSLRKHPVPDTTVTTTAITFPTTAAVLNFRLEYFRLGADLSSYAFEIPSSWTKTIRHYAMYKAYKRHGDGFNSKLYKHYQARWEFDLDDLRKARGTLVSSRRVIAGRRGTGTRGRRPPTPRLPWRYGRIVRG